MKRSVVAVIVDNQNQFVAIKRRDVPIWVLPGGGIDENESPEDAVIREAYEETGLKVAIKRQVAEYIPINKLSYPTYLFECTVLEGNLQTGSETRDIGFFESNQPPNPFFYIHLHMLKDMLCNESALIIKEFSQVTYWEFIKYCIKHPIFVFRFALSRLGFPMNSK